METGKQVYNGKDKKADACAPADRRTGMRDWRFIQKSQLKCGKINKRGGGGQNWKPKSAAGGECLWVKTTKIPTKNSGNFFGLKYGSGKWRKSSCFFQVVRNIIGTAKNHLIRDLSRRVGFPAARGGGPVLLPDHFKDCQRAYYGVPWGSEQN